MISIHLNGLIEHLMFVALLCIIVGAPIVAYVAGRSDGRDEADEAWREVTSDLDGGGY